jgi:AhpD family alkylhydroperoxidase
MNTARMKNPAMLLPEAVQAIHALVAAMKTDAIPARTLELVHLRVSQINGCAACLDMHARTLKNGGETDERLFTVAAWRETPFFTDAERAALALAEAATRLADKPDPVPDAVWDEAARHYDEKALAVLVLQIGVINMFNRFNVTTRQMAGSFRQVR